MNDLGFVQRCVNGGGQAWDEFLNKYSRLIYCYIHKIIKSKGYISKQDHAEDIFHELFCSLIKEDCKKLKSFQARNGCSLASWLRQVTVNFTIDYLRKIKPTISIDQETENGFSLKEILSDSSLSTHDKVSFQEEAERLKQCVEKLDSDDKFFLELHFDRGIRLEDMKDLLNLSRGAIDMQKSRLLSKLRECFKGKGFMLDF